MERVGERIGRLMLIGIPDPDLSDQTKRLLEAVRPGFLVLFSRNIEDAEQITRLLGAVETFLGYAPVAAIDQEGGRVTRLRDGFTVVPAARAVAEGGGPAAARRTGEIIGREMAAVGLRWNFAPVVDVLTNRDNPGVGLRSYGETVEVVVGCARAFLEGLRSAGVEGCLKHFPGLGRAAVDPHHALPTVDVAVSDLEAVELAPYAAPHLRIDAAAWMPTHVAVPALDAGLTPASLSKRILTGLVRVRLGFDGVLVADDLLMGGVTAHHGPGEAAVAALAAGMDILTLCHEPETQVAAFAELCRRVDESAELQQRLDESLGRVSRFCALLPARPQGASVIGRDEDAAWVRELSRAAIHGPSTEISRPTLVLAPRDRGYSPAAEPTDGVPGAAIRVAREWRVRLLPYSADAPPPDEALTGAVLLFTENARRAPTTARLVESIIKRARSAGATVSVVALGSPADAGIPGCEDATCTVGSFGPQEDAVVDHLTRRLEPR